MPFRKFIVIPVLFALLAASIMLGSKFFPGSSSAVGGPGLLVFICFQGWALYFTAGATLRGAAEVFLSTVASIILSIAIVLLGSSFAVSLGSAVEPNYYLGSALAVFIVAIPMISLERIPMFGYLSAVFIGSGMFFAIMTLGGDVALVNGVAVKVGIPHTVQGFMSIAVPQLMGITVGLAYGFMSAVARGAYEARVARGRVESAS